MSIGSLNLRVFRVGNIWIGHWANFPQYADNALQFLKLGCYLQLISFPLLQDVLVSLCYDLHPGKFEPGTSFFIIYLWYSGDFGFYQIVVQACIPFHMCNLGVIWL